MHLLINAAVDKALEITVQVIFWINNIYAILREDGAF